MNFKKPLLIVAAGLLMSGSSCNGPIVRPSPPHHPAPCLDDCKPYLDALPREDDAIGRKLWELNAIWDYKACVDTHRECRRMLEEQTTP